MPFYAARLEVTSDTMALNNVIYCTLEDLKKQYDLRSIDTFLKATQVINSFLLYIHYILHALHTLLTAHITCHTICSILTRTNYI